jgi:predicted O-methyltransferase YrrM
MASRQDSVKVKLRRFIQRSRFLNLLPRFITATNYFNYRYLQILKWLFTSKEDTNFTFPITKKCRLEMALQVSAITGVTAKQVLAIFDELEQDEKLRKHIVSKIKKSVWKNCADFDIHYGKRLVWYTLVRITHPEVVIETGVDKGLGSVILAAAVMKNYEEGFVGKYYGTDINPDAGYLLDGVYAQFGEILYGDSIKSLKAFNKKIDLFINDSDHSADYEGKEYETIMPKLSKKAIILGDNSHVTGELSKFSFKYNRKYAFIKEESKNHWYAGDGIGISYK